MKISRIVLILLAVLVAMGAALSVIGSGGEYAAEKLFYRASKNLRTIAMNPDVAPPAMTAAIENTLKSIVERYPQTNVAKATPLTLIEFYVYQKKYDEAFKEIDKLLLSDEKNRNVLSMAQFMKGAAYEKQGKWDSAKKEFLILRDSYPDTKTGLQAPLYIAKHEGQKGEEAAIKAYEEASRFYENLAKTNEGKPIGYEATNILMGVKLGMKRFDEAASIMENAIDKYPLQLILAQYIPYVEPIMIKQLKDTDRATSFYKKVIGKTDNEQVKKKLQERIDFLQQKK